MSDATLKRKTLAKYNNSSVGQAQFSLNGGYRNQGWVGQTNLSRSFPRTLMRDGVARGYGGKGTNTFFQAPIVSSGLTYQENPNVIKASVLDNAGMLETKFQWPRRPKPFSSLKPDTNNQALLNSAAFHTEKRAQAAMAEINAQPTIPKKTTMCCTRVDGVPRISGGNLITKPVVKDYGTTQPNRWVALPYGTYLLDRAKCNLVCTADQRFLKTPVAKPCAMLPGFN